MNQSVERALVVLEELQTGAKRLGDLAATLGTHKSTVLRILQTLEARGFVRREETGAYRLGLRMLELGATALEDLDLRSAARDGLEKLAGAIGETVHLALLDRGSVVYLDKVESTHPVRMYSRVGATAPAHCTGVGKVLLAYTPYDAWPELTLTRFTPDTITDVGALQAAGDAIRARGWGTDEREHEDSIRCIAAPVFDTRGNVAAAISVSAPAVRLSAEDLAGHIPDLLDCARTVTRELGGDTGLVGPRAEGT